MRDIRTAAVAVVSATTLVLPSVSAWSAAAAQAATSKKVVATKTFSGAPGSAGRWGDVDVVVVVRKTTTTNLQTRKKAIARRITSVRVPTSPNHTSRSIFINQNALPLLIQETIKVQGTTVDIVSGATNTTNGFEQSLQSALVKARAW